jgi:hypothetical protein
MPGLPGIYECEVVAVSPSFPMVPYKVEKSLHWLGVAGDSCTTTITAIEIDYFRTHGYTVEVIQGYYWEREEYVFSAFIGKCERLEQEGGSLKAIAKIMRNSLYGRFGTRKEMEHVIITDKPPNDGTHFPICDPKTGEDFEDMYAVTEEVNAEYIQPHWAAYITAYQRLAMFDTILTVGVTNCLGVDTDSIKYEKRHDKILVWNEGTCYGSTHIENSWKLYRSHGPKDYVTEQDGILAFKKKGIPKRFMTQAMLKTYLSMDEYTPTFDVPYISITKALTMLKADGTLAYMTPRTRRVGLLHSSSWQIVNGLFVVQANPLNVLSQKEDNRYG